MVHKLPDCEKTYNMRVICGWCKKFLYWDICYKPGETSHGICDTCKAKQFEKQLDLPGIP